MSSKGEVKQRAWCGWTPWPPACGGARLWTCRPMGRWSVRHCRCCLIQGVVVAKQWSNIHHHPWPQCCSVLALLLLWRCLLWRPHKLGSNSVPSHISHTLTEYNVRKGRKWEERLRRYIRAVGGAIGFHKPAGLVSKMAEDLIDVGARREFVATMFAQTMEDFGGDGPSLPLPYLCLLFLTLAPPTPTGSRHFPLLLLLVLCAHSLKPQIINGNGIEKRELSDTAL